MSKKDIRTLEDIQFIITQFYDQLLNDAEMRPFFEEIVEQNQLEAHIQTISYFWSDILFDTLLYRENVMQKHLVQHQFRAFKKVHFNSWTSYFFNTIDSHFSGLNAHTMKNRATSIATVMQLKMKID